MIRFEQGQEIDEATRATLASGRADPALALFLDSLFELRGLEDPMSEAFVGASLEAEPEAEMSANALDRAFAAIDALKKPAPAADLRAHDFIRIPAAVQSAIADAEAAKGWRNLTPGIACLPLDMGGRVKAEIMRIAPGVATPRHTHKGRELTLCLAGGFSDHRGSYGPGDIAVGDPGVTHQPRADDDGPCLVLAVTDADLAFTGVLGVLQKLFGK
jgi:putative transcriptional regulator